MSAWEPCTVYQILTALQALKTEFDLSKYLRIGSRPVASQPGGGGGSELGWVEHQAHPPLDIVRVTSSALRKIGKHPPLGHSQAPPNC